jgi:hypothetical protein
MRVTICILTYGNYPALMRRVVESVRRYCPRAEYQLVVGANAVSDETASYLKSVKTASGIDRLVFSEANINKCPMMRRMFELVETELIWWFDDDSYLTERTAFARWRNAAAKASTQTVMWGKLAVCSHPKAFVPGLDAVAFVRSADWYCGLPPPSWRLGGKGEFDFERRGTGDGRWFFILGGSWMIRTSAIQALDWPDRRLTKLGDDVLLGEAIRQQGWLLQNMDISGVAINTEPRRGDAGSFATMNGNDKIMRSFSANQT